ncbi:hypothetical protein C0J52_00378 [Blattella germanica]|nr:hypothetical protein C0J52_00378 [Blattella germanica]
MWEGILNYFLTRFGFRSERKRAREVEDDENDEEMNEPLCKQRKTQAIKNSFMSSEQFLCPTPNWRNPRQRSMASSQPRTSTSKTEKTWSTEAKENVIDISDSEDVDIVGVWQDANTLRKKPIFKSGAGLSNGRKYSSEEEDIQIVKVIEAPNKQVDRSGNCISLFQTPSSRVTSSLSRLTVDSSGSNKSPLLHQRLKILRPKCGQGSSTMEQADDKPRLNLNLALNESFRLEDKMRYSELLQQFTSLPLQGRSIAPLHNTTRWAQKRELLNFASQERKNFRKDIVDLTKTKEEKTTQPNKKRVEVRTDKEAEPTVSSSRFQNGTDGQASSSSRKSSVDSLKLNHYADSDYISIIHEKYKQKKEVWEKQEDEERLKSEHFQKRERRLQLESLERLTNYLKITDAICEDVELEEKSALPKITREMEEVIESALSGRPTNEFLISAFKLTVTRRDMQTLVGLNWLNDEVINFYMELLNERGKQSNYPSVYAFNTFFYPKLLMKDGYSSLRRWTKKVDIFSYDLVIVPVHLGVHWCMAAIDFREKVIKYYDSMGAPNHKCLESLMEYLKMESLDKKKKPFDSSSWRTENVQNIPQQMNGSDCGMFACTYAEYLCRNADFRFTQQDMPYFRKKMVYEIATKRLLL